MRWRCLLVAASVPGSLTLGLAFAGPSVRVAAPAPQAPSRPAFVRTAAPGAGAPLHASGYVVAARMGWAIG